MKKDLEIVTYIGSHKFGFYKDLRPQLQNLKSNLRLFEYNLKVYDNQNLRKLIGLRDLNIFYLLTRYGAGAWFWKPKIILDALERTNCNYLIYIDVDCLFKEDPLPHLKKYLNKNSLAFFNNPLLLTGHISSRAIRELGLNTAIPTNSNLVTAGVILIKNCSEAKKSLKIWSKEMENPKVLLHPAISFKKEKHLHDQSVISALIASGQINAKIMNRGFFSKGPETLENKVSDCWVYTGIVDSGSTHFTIRKRIKSILDNYERNSYEILKNIVIYPVHLSLYILMKKLNKMAFKQCNLKQYY